MEIRYLVIFNSTAATCTHAKIIKASFDNVYMYAAYLPQWVFQLKWWKLMMWPRNLQYLDILVKGVIKIINANCCWRCVY